MLVAEKTGPSEVKRTLRSAFLLCLGPSVSGFVFLNRFAPIPEGGRRMSRFRVHTSWMLILAVLLLGVSAFAQTTASIKGNATDSSGAAVVGAQVTVKGPLGIERGTQTNA